MNFLCENCKQKYHVADEKLRGRAVTKFKCKKCEHIIEVKASDVPPPGAPGSDAADASGSESIPPSGSTTGTMAALVVPKAAGAPASTAGSSSPIAASTASSSPKPSFGTAGSKPEVSKLPTAAPRPTSASAGALPAARSSGPGSGATSASAAAATKVTPMAAAKPAAAPVSAIASKPAPVSKPSNNALRSSINQNADSRATTSSAPADGPRRKDSSTSALLNSAETGWYAGIRDVPVGPLTRAEVLAKIEGGDVTADTLVWREGLDDWRALQQVNELSDLLREASKKIGESVIGTGSKKSSPPNNVVPISRANPSKDAADEPEESTRLTSLSDLIATAEGAATKKALTPTSTASQRVSEPKPQAKVESQPVAKAEIKTEPARPAAKVESAPVEAKPKAEVPPASAAEDSLEDDFFSKIPAKSSPATSPSTPTVAKDSEKAMVATASKDAFVLDGPAATATAPAPATAAVVAVPSVTPVADAQKLDKSEKTAQKSGVPVGVWVLVGGLVIAAGGGGMLAGTRINQPPAQPTTQAVPTTPAQQPAQQPRLDPQIGAQINVNTQDPPTNNAATTPPVQPQVAANSTPEHHPTTPAQTGNGRPHVAANGTSTAASAGNTHSSGGLTAEQRAEMARLLGGNGVGGVGPGTGGPTVTARATQTAETAPVQGPTGSARAQQVLDTFNRTSVIRSCWQQQITRNPAHPAERLTVTLTVGSTGRATEVRVGGANDPALATCISNRARSQNFGPGGQIDAQATFNLAIGQ